MVPSTADKHEDAIEEAAITQLVMANRILARESIIDNFGHVSLRHPLHADRYLLSRSRSPENVTRDDIMEFTLDGEQLRNDPRTPYSERHIHGALYKVRPDLNAVIHHHARPVLPFTMLGIPLRPVFHMAAVIGNQVPVWESQDEFGDTNMLVDSMEMGLSLARCMGQGNSVLMRGHGAVCAGADARAAVMVAIGLRDNAEITHATRLLGKAIPLTDGEVAKTGSMLLSEMPLARAWDYWVARAGFPGL